MHATWRLITSDQNLSKSAPTKLIPKSTALRNVWNTKSTFNISKEHSNRSVSDLWFLSAPAFRKQHTQWGQIDHRQWQSTHSVALNANKGRNGEDGLQAQFSNSKDWSSPSSTEWREHRKEHEPEWEHHYTECRAIERARKGECWL